MNNVISQLVQVSKHKILDMTGLVLLYPEAKKGAWSKSLISHVLITQSFRQHKVWNLGG